MTSLTGLESIRQITSQVSIDEVPELADLSGLSGLENVSGRVLIDAVHMKTVELPALKEVDSYVLIQALGSVERIALPSLTIVKDYVDINNTSATFRSARSTPSRPVSISHAAPARTTAAAAARELRARAALHTDSSGSPLATRLRRRASP